jgi:hypothetical protein
LNAIATADLSPGTKRLGQSFAVMTALLSQFGDKAPLVGAFLKGYGDVAGEVLKTTLALDGKIAAREGGQMIDGVHGERGHMLDRLRAHGMSDAQRLVGLRDVFRAENGKLVIWDKTARDWVVASDFEAGLTAEELTKRYLFYAKLGVSEPTPDQIVRGYRKTIALTLEPSVDHVAPGQTVTLTVHGKLVDGAKVDGMAFFAKVALKDHTGVGEGTFSGDTTVKLGDSVSWTAPNNVNETYTFTVDLDADTAKAAFSAGAATAVVRTGDETRLVLEADATQAAADQEVRLTARVLTVDGQPIDARAAGMIDLAADPQLGFFTDQKDLTDAKGVTVVWTAPKQPGKYTIKAHYPGATAYALFGTHTAACGGDRGRRGRGRRGAGRRRRRRGGGRCRGRDRRRGADRRRRARAARLAGNVAGQGALDDQHERRGLHRRRADRAGDRSRRERQDRDHAKGVPAGGDDAHAVEPARGAGGARGPGAEPAAAQDAVLEGQAEAGVVPGRRQAEPRGAHRDPLARADRRRQAAGGLLARAGRDRAAREGEEVSN